MLLVVIDHLGGLHHHRLGGRLLDLLQEGAIDGGRVGHLVDILYQRGQQEEVLVLSHLPLLAPLLYLHPDGVALAAILIREIQAIVLALLMVPLAIVLEDVALHRLQQVEPLADPCAPHLFEKHVLDGWDIFLQALKMKHVMVAYILTIQHITIILKVIGCNLIAL